MIISGDINADFLCVRNWYQFFTCKGNEYQFFTCKKNWYQFFTYKRNWYQFFTHAWVIGTNSSHPKKQRSKVWRILTNSLHVRNCQRILHMCEKLVPILHIRGKVAPVLHRCDEYIPVLHTSEIINMRNLGINFRPQNLSKLTIRKFHIWQMRRIGTNSSYGCEIYEMRNLRFNKAPYLYHAYFLNYFLYHFFRGITQNLFKRFCWNLINW